MQSADAAPAAEPPAGAPDAATRPPSSRGRTGSASVPPPRSAPAAETVREDGDRTAEETAGPGRYARTATARRRRIPARS